MRAFRIVLGSVFTVCVLAFSAPQQSVASIVNVTITSTTNNAYNDHAYLQNTGISVHAGDLVQLIGTGQISVGGGKYVRTSFDMGLISPTNSSFLVRDYYGLGNNYTGTPVALTSESVLFSQQRNSLADQHDLVLSVPVLTNGYMYLGLFDSYFADNTGSHSFAIQVTPEPATVCCLAPALVLFRRSKRRTNS